MTIEITEGEFDTILAALRYWQRVGLPNALRGGIELEEEYEIASYNGPALNSEQIDYLCHAINSK